MKKISITILVIVLACFSANAQVKFGVKGGVNFNNFSTSKELSLDNATSWQVGLMTRFKLPIIQLGVQPELLYTIKSAKVDGDTKNSSYLQVPLNVIWTFQVAGLGPFISVGPYFNYAINLNSAIEDIAKKFDWGIAAGAGLDISKFELGLRYEWGMQNIADQSGISIKNNSFNIYLGYFF